MRNVPYVHQRLDSILELCRTFRIEGTQCLLTRDMQILDQMSRDMRFPTMWYVRPAKPQISLRTRSVWSEPWLVAWIFYDCQATDWTPFGISKPKRRLYRLIWVYTCQNATLLEIMCRGSDMVTCFWYISASLSMSSLVSNVFFLATCLHLSTHSAIATMSPVFVSRPA